MKNKNLKILCLLFTLFLFYSCSGLQYYQIDTPYGIVKNGKVDRMGIPRNDYDKMNLIISEKYGIYFHNGIDHIIISSNLKNQFIKFYDDVEFIVKEKKYIVQKENIIEYSYKPFYEIININNFPIDLTSPDFNDLILELGEIDIVDKSGNIIKRKQKIPPLLFKKRYYKEKYGQRYEHSGWIISSPPVIYKGWAEDYDKKKVIKEFREKKKLKKDKRKREERIDKIAVELLRPEEPEVIFGSFSNLFTGKKQNEQFIRDLTKNISNLDQRVWDSKTKKFDFYEKTDIAKYIFDKGSDYILIFENIGSLSEVFEDVYQREGGGGILEDCRFVFLNDVYPIYEVEKIIELSKQYGFKYKIIN